jgi:hypothetical protein
MRRLLAIAAMAAVVLTGAACNNKTDTTTTPTTAAPTSAAGNAANKAVCDAAKKAVADGMTAIIPQVTALQNAVIKGDKAAQTKGIADLKTSVTAWATSMKATADSVTDPEFKATLAAIASAVETAGSQIKGVEDAGKVQELLSSPAVLEAGTKMEKLCPAS